jgi:hypothetical protein
MTWAAEKTLVTPAPAQAPPTEQRQPERPASRAGHGPLRCLWYDVELADAMTAVDEFLRTQTAITALAQFYRVRRASSAPESDARMLVDAVGVTAARLRA